MTTFETLYRKFYDLIEKDSDFFNYNNVSQEDALQIAEQRAKNYLIEAVSHMKLLCDLDIEIIVDIENEVIEPELVDTEILLIASLMYEIYLSRDIVTLKAMTNVLTSSDIKLLYAPSNERKTFMSMYKEVCSANEVLVDKYNGRDRLTNKRKSLNYNG